MKKYITDERTGLKYELVGDYYLIAGDGEPDEEQKPIGIWGQRHLRYLKNHRKVFYANLLTSGKLNNYLADIDKQAKEMFERLIKQMATADGITEQLKAADQMAWIHYKFVGYLELPSLGSGRNYREETRKGVAVEYVPNAQSA